MKINEIRTNSYNNDILVVLETNQGKLMKTTFVNEKIYFSSWDFSKKETILGEEITGNFLKNIILKIKEYCNIVLEVKIKVLHTRYLYMMKLDVPDYPKQHEIKSEMNSNYSERGRLNWIISTFQDLEVK